jgi:hypothetical protein
MHPLALLYEKELKEYNARKIHVGVFPSYRQWLANKAVQLYDALAQCALQAQKLQNPQQDMLDDVLHQAVASQYFGEQHKHRAHLYDIMRTIDPEIAKVFDDDPAKAFDITYERKTGEKP